ncbi:MAG: dihydroxy-acid dehydratase, partial [Chloroflexi bacterium]|nr:dihydroxy-acid dehydratase [Chloroflexota bacterium]
AGGPSIPAISFEESRRLRTEFLQGRLSERELAEGNAELYSTPGNCPYIGTANTMSIMAEALGMALPGSALAPASSHRRMLYCEDAGKAAVRLAVAGITSRQIMTRKAFINALRVAAALGGSSNYVLHIPAIAARAGVQITFDDIDQVNQATPLLARIAPNGRHSVVDLDRAGGVPAVMNELKELLDLDLPTITSATVGENLRGAAILDPTVIHPASDPLDREGGIVILKGNLAPHGAVVKRSAVDPQLFHYVGPARVFNSEQSCIDAVQAGQVNEGDVLVVNYEGPKGGPGMREMHRLSNVLKSMQSRIALITDGRFSGADSGLMIGYVSPEAAVGGPIGVLRDGDSIEIDLANRQLNLQVPAGELEQRLAAFTPHQKDIQSEFLGRYQDLVGPASCGAVW